MFDVAIHLQKVPKNPYRNMALELSFLFHIYLFIFISFYQIISNNFIELHVSVHLQSH